MACACWQMARRTVKDVPADKFIKEYAALLKRQGKVRHVFGCILTCVLVRPDIRNKKGGGTKGKSSGCAVAVPQLTNDV